MFRDQAKSYISSEEIKQMCKSLGRQIEQDYKGKKLLVICILKGGVVFSADLVREIHLPMKIEFVRLASYGDAMESSGVVKIIKGLSSSIQDQDVLVLEDILDTGCTLSFFYDYLKKLGPASLKICTLLDKPSRRKAKISADYVGKAIEDRFVIGYGLDYQEKCRNYSDVMYVN